MPKLGHETRLLKHHFGGVLQQRLLAGGLTPAQHVVLLPTYDAIGELFRRVVEYFLGAKTTLLLLLSGRIAARSEHWKLVGV